MIKLQVIGHLGRDCEVKTVNSKTVINFPIAHTEKYRVGDEQKEKTTWVDCAYWLEKTEISKYLKKGKQVYVEGTPDTRSWTAKDGTAGCSLSLRVYSVQLLGGADKPSNGTAAASTANANDAADDLPF